VDKITKVELMSLYRGCERLRQGHFDRNGPGAIFRSIIRETRRLLDNPEEIAHVKARPEYLPEVMRFLESHISSSNEEKGGDQ
jgi:hypothetical protein